MNGAATDPRPLLAATGSELRKRSFLAQLLRRAWGPNREPARTRGGNTSALAGESITKQLLLQVEREAQRHGAPLVVLLFPGYGYASGQRADYTRAVEFFRRELPSLELVDLTAAFDREEPPLHGRFVEHWNAAGARLVARELSRHLVRNHARHLR